MKQPKLSNLKTDVKGTKALRKQMSKVKKIKITINIDQDSLEHLRDLAQKTGTPYQRIINQLLKQGLENQSSAQSRLEKLEKELAFIKQKLAA